MLLSQGRSKIIKMGRVSIKTGSQRQIRGEYEGWRGATCHATRDSSNIEIREYSPVNKDTEMIRFSATEGQVGLRVLLHRLKKDQICVGTRNVARERRGG